MASDSYWYIERVQSTSKKKKEFFIKKSQSREIAIFYLPSSELSPAQGKALRVQIGLRINYIESDSA